MSPSPIAFLPFLTALSAFAQYFVELFVENINTYACLAPQHFFNLSQFIFECSILSSTHSLEFRGWELSITSYTFKVVGSYQFLRYVVVFLNTLLIKALSKLAKLMTSILKNANVGVLEIGPPCRARPISLLQLIITQNDSLLNDQTLLN